jgi:hypothetical protein
VGMRKLLSFGRAKCDSNVGGFRLVVYCLGYWMLGCIFQCWMLAFTSRVMIVRDGIGSWSNFICIVELEARFWHIRVYF